MENNRRVNLAPKRLQELVTTEAQFINTLSEFQNYVNQIAHKDIKDKLSPARLHYASLFTLTDEFSQLGNITEANFYHALQTLYGIFSSQAFLTNFSKMVAVAERHSEISNAISIIEESYQNDPQLDDYKEIFCQIDSYLIRPAQRLARYDLLLQEIQKDYQKFIGSTNNDATLNKITEIRRFYENTYAIAAKNLTKMLTANKLNTQSVVIQGYLLEMLRAATNTQESTRRLSEETASLNSSGNSYTFFKAQQSDVSLLYGEIHQQPMIFNRYKAKTDNATLIYTLFGTSPEMFYTLLIEKIKEDLPQTKACLKQLGATILTSVLNKTSQLPQKLYNELMQFTENYQANSIEEAESALLDRCSKSDVCMAFIKNNLQPKNDLHLSLIILWAILHQTNIRVWQLPAGSTQQIKLCEQYLGNNEKEIHEILWMNDQHFEIIKRNTLEERLDKASEEVRTIKQKLEDVLEETRLTRK